MSAGTEARKIGGDILVRFFDAVWAEQRLRWNCPDWKEAPITEADLVNWRDVAAALRRVLEGPEAEEE